jgi:hypothetical protein
MQDDHYNPCDIEALEILRLPRFPYADSTGRIAALHKLKTLRLWQGVFIVISIMGTYKEKGLNRG